MNNLNALTLKQTKEDLKAKKFSSLELTKACLDRIREANQKLNAFISVFEKEAIKSAESADKLISQDKNLPLLGIPVALKDMYSFGKTTAASKVLDDYNSPYSATSVRRLTDAGAVIIGKTNQDAWAHGSSGENSDYGPTKNPWSKDHVPGGSSSGSAVAVATDMAIAATGTDTGGSIRLPASFTNTVGLKPTYGRVSRYGMVAMASSHDSIGHFSKTVEDSALFLNITAGNDDMDATTSSAIVLNYTENIGKGVKGLKIGTDPDFFSKHIENESLGLLKDAYNLIKNILKAEIVPDISLPHSSYANACYYILQPSEVSSNLARYDGIRYGNDRSYFGDEAKRRIMLGTHTLSSGYYDQYYNRALKVRSIIIDEFKKAFQRVDAIIAPISPTPPWKLGEKTDDPLKMYLSDIFTVTANLTGLPALSIPIGFTKKGLPVGMQIIGNYFSEDILFRIGHAYEQATNWNTKKPNL